MRITILGSAAGGGFPQWNCNCRNCAGVRSGGVGGYRAAGVTAWMLGGGTAGLPGES